MSEEATSSRSDKICNLCNEKLSKYCCPRCELFYCSIDCYKSEKHITCSESFYRDCVSEEIASFHTNEGTRQKMINVLQKMHDDDIAPDQLNNLLENVDRENDSDDDEGLDLHERVKNLNLDDPDVIWEVLTEDEKNEFQALISQGYVESIIPQWVPWWSFHRQEKLIQEVGEKDSKEDEALKQCPKFKIVPKLDSFTRLRPSPAIKFNIINAISAYAFVLRYFNGDLEPVEGTAYFLNICDNLDKNTNFQNLLAAIDSVAQRCLQSELIETDETSLDVMQQDTFSIIQGPSKDNKTFYSRAAMSDLHIIFSQAKSLSKNKTESNSKDRREFSRIFPDHKLEHLPKFDGGKLKKCIKKVEYYLSYIETYGLDLE